MGNKKTWEYKEHFHAIGMTGDYSGHYEVTNGDISLCTNDDPEDITETENTLQKVARVLNESDCKFYCDTTTEHKLHIENMELRYKMDDLKDQAQRMADALEFVKANGLCSETTEMINASLQQFKDGKGKEPVREIEYMPIHPNDAMKFDCPTQFPMHLLSEEQAQSNHGQTLKRLKERGGLSVREILAIVGKKKWSYYANIRWEDAIKMLNDILTNPTK